jgi:hypothetical protein
MVAGNKLSVNKTKKEAQHDVEFAEGGDDKMFGEQAAEPQKEGQTDQEASKGPGAKYAEGGKSKMFGYQGSVPAKEGQTGAR